MVLVVGIDPTTTDLSGQRLTIRPNELWGERRDLNPLTLESHSSRYPLCVRSHFFNSVQRGTGFKIQTDLQWVISPLRYPKQLHKLERDIRNPYLHGDNDDFSYL